MLNLLKLLTGLIFIFLVCVVSACSGPEKKEAAFEPYTVYLKIADDIIFSEVSEPENTPKIVVENLTESYLQREYKRPAPVETDNIKNADNYRIKFLRDRMNSFRKLRNLTREATKDVRIYEAKWGAIGRELPPWKTYHSEKGNAWLDQITAHDMTSDRNQLAARKKRKVIYDYDRMKPVKSKFKGFLILTGEEYGYLSTPSWTTSTSARGYERTFYISEEKVLMGRRVLVSCKKRQDVCVVHNLDKLDQNRARVQFYISGRCTTKELLKNHKLGPIVHQVCATKFNLMDELVSKIISEVGSKIYLYDD